MKNKKLFAILTLVCFMFTLMPVAAFADVDVQETYIYTEEANAEVDVNEEVTLTFDEVDELYIWFEETANVPSTALGTLDASGNFVAAPNGILKVADVTAGEVKVAFKREGTYELHAAVQAPTKNDTNNTWSKAVAAVADYELQTEDDYKTVEVSADVADSDDYVIKYGSKTYEDGETIDVIVGDEVANGIEEKTIKFTVYENDEEGAATVYAKGVEVNGTAKVSINDLEAKRNGEVSFDVVIDKVGTHKVYVVIDDFKVTFKIDANEGKADKIVVSNEPKAAVNIETINEEGSFAGFLAFDIFDENGNKLTAGVVDDVLPGAGYDKALVAGNNYVSVVSQPAKSKVENEDLKLSYEYYNAAGDAAWTIVSDAKFVEEGEYTFKVALDDGTSAKATVKLVEANDPVALSISYFTDSVQLGGQISPKSIGWLDENNAFTSVLSAGKITEDEIEFAVTGAAVEKVVDTTIYVKDDEKYVGSEIVVTVVDEENDLVATKTLTVANEAKELAFDTTTAPVDMARTIGVTLVDEAGKTVGLNATTASAYVVVLSKPADCDVTAEVKGNYVNATKGTFDINFSADKVGAVTLQAVLKAEVDGVVRYYTGTQVVTVGAAGIDDIVVMSIGSNEVVINGEVKTIDAAPIVENNRTFVPFRALAEAFGATVAYDEATQSVTAELNGVTVVMTIGSAEYTVNGEAATMDVAPFINGSRTMIPVRFAAQAFGIDVTPTYDDNGATADVVFTK